MKSGGKGVKGSTWMLRERQAMSDRELDAVTPDNLEWSARLRVCGGALLRWAGHRCVVMASGQSCLRPGSVEREGK